MSLNSIFKQIDTIEYGVYSNQMSQLRDENSDFVRMGEDKRKGCCYPILQKDNMSMKFINTDQSEVFDEEEVGNMVTHRQMDKQRSQLRQRTVGKRRTYLRNYNSIQNINSVSNSKIDLQIDLGNDAEYEEKIIKGLTEEEKKKAQIAEQKAIVKNAQYEKLMKTNAEVKQQKINTMVQALNLVVIVASFLNSIKQYGQSYKFKRMRENQFSVIGDKSSDYEYYFEKKFFIGNQPSRLKMCWIQVLQSLQKSIIFQYVNQKIFKSLDWSQIVMKPNSIYKIIWDIYILFLLSLNIFYVPVKITWEDNKMGGLHLAPWVSIFLNDLPGWTFLVDISLTFNTAYYSKGIIIFDKKKIVKNYLKTKFVGDLLVVIPFIVSLKLNLVLLNAVLLLRTNKMIKLAQYFEQLVNLKPHQAALYNLCKLVFTIVFVAHFAGCMFFLVGSFEMQNNLVEKTWIENARIENKDWLEQYITSLYWAVITMITIGYGDITPITVYERAFVILVTLISCGVFAYSVNQIGTLVQALTSNSNELKQKMGQLIRHLRNRGVSYNLQMQVRKYFEYWHQGKDENDGEQCDLMIENLSNNLKQEVLSDIRIRLINQMPILKNNFSAQFLKKVANHIKTKRTKPEEILIEDKQTNDKLYFLVSGSMNQFISIKKDYYSTYTTIKTIKPNAIFDQISFMGDLPCLTGYRSIGSCTLYYINKEDFMSEMHNYEEDQQKYQLIKDNIVVYKSQRNIGTRCNFCDKYTHSFDRCPFIKYIPYTEKSIILHSTSIEQIRIPHKRRETSNQTLSGYQQLKETTLYYLIEFNPFQNEEELIEKLISANKGDQEFNQKYNQNSEQQGNKGNLNNIIEEQNSRLNEELNSKNLDDQNEKQEDQKGENTPQQKQPSLLINAEIPSPTKTLNFKNIFYQNKTNDSQSVNPAGDSCNVEGVILQKNNSILNTQQSAENNEKNIHQNVNQQNLFAPQQVQNHGYQILEQSNTDTTQSQDLNQVQNNIVSTQVPNQNVNTTPIQQKRKIVKSPQMKKRQSNMSNLTQKQKDILLQVNQGNNNINLVNHNMQNLSPIQITNQPRLFQDQMKIGKKNTDEYEVKQLENEYIQSPSIDQGFSNNLTNKKKSFNRIITISDQQQQLSYDEISQAGQNDKRFQKRKNSENQNSMNIGYSNTNNMEYEDVQLNLIRRSSTASRKISLLQLQHNISNQQSIQQLLQQQYIQQPSYYHRKSIALQNIQKQEFMPILCFEKMMEFKYYYPSGNYKNVIEKLQSLNQKRENYKDREDDKFKRNVNKNMILKRSVIPQKVSSPGSSNRKKTFIQQDSFRNSKAQQNKTYQTHQQSSFFQGHQQSSFSMNA